MTRPAEPLLDVKRVAEICGVTTKTVRRWIAAGKLPHTRLGGPRGLIRIHCEHLDTFLRAEAS